MYTVRKLKAFNNTAPLSSVYYIYEHGEEMIFLEILNSCHTSNMCLHFGNKDALLTFVLFFLYEMGLSMFFILSIKETPR